MTGFNWTVQTDSKTEVLTEITSLKRHCAYKVTDGSFPLNFLSARYEEEATDNCLISN